MGSTMNPGEALAILESELLIGFIGGNFGVVIQGHIARDDDFLVFRSAGMPRADHGLRHHGQRIRLD